MAVAYMQDIPISALRSSVGPHSCSAWTSNSLGKDPNFQWDDKADVIRHDGPRYAYHVSGRLLKVYLRASWITVLTKLHQALLRHAPHTHLQDTRP